MLMVVIMSLDIHNCVLTHVASYTGNAYNGYKNSMTHQTFLSVFDSLQQSKSRKSLSILFKYLMFLGLIYLYPGLVVSPTVTSLHML